MGQPVIFFDGTCVLCDSFVQWMLRHDRRRVFLFAALQGRTAREAGFEADAQGNFGSIILREEGTYRKSDAALRILTRLGGPWKLMSFFYIVPRPLRDLVYDFIARHRYGWFGKREHCRVPSPSEKERFLP